ncbi:MAG: DUF3601 domain-containing protein [Anaerolineales bacterium]|nr:DUF3601 domain-containing protein [Anaerolineales bacterium]
MDLTIYTLEEGVVYIVTKPFQDYYNNSFNVGEKFTYASRNFSPYQGGHTIVFKERSLYLHEEANVNIIDAFHEYFQIHDASKRVAKPTPSPAKKKNRILEELGNLAICLLFVAAGVWIVFFSNEQNKIVVIVGWFGMVFFGLGALLSIRAMLKSKW